MSSRIRNRALLGGLLTVSIAALLAVPFALGAGYGRGTFTGEMRPKFGNDRPKTPIRIKVKGDRARILRAVLVFDCYEGAPLRRTIDTSFTRVKDNPSGGVVYIDDKVTPNKGNKNVEIHFFLELGAKSIRGDGDATLDVDGSPCTDDVIFRAN
jgi:hypothetical protein